MNRRLLGILGSVLVTGTTALPVHASEPAWVREVHRESPTKQPLPVRIETLPANWQEALKKVMTSPTLSTSSAADRFQVNDEFYRWLLDNPDRVGVAWGRLGVPAVEIKPLGNGRFTWSDDQGSELTWLTVSESEQGRVWYADGKVKLGPLMPLIPIRAVAVVRHEATRDAKGRISVKHSLEAYLQTDSKFANLATRLLGPAAPRMAEQAADQLLFYFSGIAKHADAHPDQAEALLAKPKKR
jgi:hypothetical protein